MSNSCILDHLSFIGLSVYRLMILMAGAVETHFSKDFLDIL